MRQRAPSVTHVYDFSEERPTPIATINYSDTNPGPHRPGLPGFALPPCTVMGDSDLWQCRIGKFCSIAAHTRLNPGNHPLHRAALHHFTYRSASYQLGFADEEDFFAWRRRSPVIVGHDVWIGHGAIVLPGLSIGNGAAIGAGAVVSRDVEAYTVVAGVPARPLRRRFPAAIAEGFEAMQWWHWSRERLAAALPDFRMLSAEDFLEKYGK